MPRLGRAPLFLACVLAVACGDDDSGTPPDARPDTHAPDADPGGVPRIEAAACRYVVPASLGLVEGADYSCGDLVVEEDRASHAGRIRVHFIRIESPVGGTNATIYFDGGPGGDGQGILSYAGALGSSFLDGLRANGDFLVISQRGTRLSAPALDCYDPDECNAISGVGNLANFNTAYNADDVNDLRVALGLDKLNLYGISYGSRLGLEVLRRHGDHVRAAVVEGLVPPQVVWTAAIPKSFHGAMTALNAECAAAGACGTTFGNLVTKLDTAVTALDADPVMIPTSQGPFPLDGVTFAYLLFRAMYARSTYPWLPYVISDLATRRTDRVGSVIASWLENDRRDVSRGMYYSVVCGELYNPPTPNAVADANAGVPQWMVDLFGSSYFSLAEMCESWPKGNLQTTLAQPVTSSVPTLVSSGTIDPITPPSFGTVAASTLSSAQVVVHASSGHGATLQSPCGAQNLHAFLANPTSAIDTSCAGSITTTFVMPSMFAMPKPSVELLRAEFALAPAPLFVVDRLRRVVDRAP